MNKFAPGTPPSTPPRQSADQSKRSSGKRSSFLPEETTPRSTRNSPKASASKSREAAATTPVISSVPVVAPLQHVFYGRSPFREGTATFLKNDKEHPDAARINISCEIDEELFSLSEGKHSQDYQPPTPDEMVDWRGRLCVSVNNENIATLIREIFPYLHSEYGWGSQALGFVFEARKLEHNLLLATRESTDHICELHIKSATAEVHLTERKEFLRCNFIPITGEKDDILLGGPKLGKEPLIKVVFDNRYALGALADNDHYDLRRRLFTHVLHSNHEKILEREYESNVEKISSYTEQELFLELRELYDNEVAQRYKADHRIQKLEAIMADVHAFYLEKNENDRVENLREEIKEKYRKNFDITLNQNIDERNSFSHEELSHEIMALINNSHQSLPSHFRGFKQESFENISFEALWDEALNNIPASVSGLIGDHSPAEQDQLNLKLVHTGKVLLEANHIEIASEYSQFAIATQDEIEASNFNELFLLHCIVASIENQSAVWEKIENKLGLCVTLFRYLEHPFSVSDKNIVALESIRGMLEVPGKIDLKQLLQLTKSVIETFLHQKQIVEKHYQDLLAYSPVMIWENVKIRLREIDLVKNLYALAAHKTDSAFQDFAISCEACFKEGASLDILKILLEKKWPSDALVQNQISFLGNIYNVCRFPYRNDFSVTPAKGELNRAEGHFFLTSHQEKIYASIEQMKCGVEQIEVLNDFYVIHACYTKSTERHLSINNVFSKTIKVLENPIEDARSFELCQTLVSELKEVLITSLSSAGLEKLRVLLVESLLRARSRNIDWLVARLNKEFTKTGEVEEASRLANGFETIALYFDKAYYLSYVTREFYKNFDAISDDYLEAIKKGCGGVDEPIYIQALILRHLYISLSGYHIHEHPQEETAKRKFLYSRFSDYPDYPEDWVNIFFEEQECAGEAKVENNTSKTVSAIRGLVSQVDSAMQESTNPEIYIQRIAESLQSIKNGEVTPFGRLSKKGQAIIRICAWMAALANRYDIRDKMEGDEAERAQSFKTLITSIYDHIESAWQEIGESVECIKHIWNEYKKLEILGEQTEEECRVVLSPKNASVARTLFSEDQTSEVGGAKVTGQSVQQFNRVGREISLSQENETLTFGNSLFPHMRTTLWRHLSERFVKNIKSFIRPESRLSSKVSIDTLRRQSLVEIESFVKAAMAEIFVTLAFLHVGDAGTQLEQAAEIIECVEDVLSSDINESVDNKKLGKKLLERIRDRLSINSELPAGQVVRAIFFSDHAYKMFRHKDFIGNMQRKFSLSKPEASEINSEYIDLKGFLVSVKDALSFAIGQLNVDGQNRHVFIPYVMEPLLTAFILVYNQLFNSKNYVPFDVQELWRECINLVGQVNDSDLEKKRYLLFVQSWKTIIESIFEKNKHSTMATHHVWINGKPTQSIPENHLHLTDYQVILAYFTYAQLNIMPNNFEPAMSLVNQLWRKQAEFDLSSGVSKALQFILDPLFSAMTMTQPILNFLANQKNPVIQVQLLGGVLCILVPNVSQRFGMINSYTLTKEISRNLVNMYRAKLDALKNSRNFSEKFPAIVFIYPQHTVTEIYCDLIKGEREIVRNDCPTARSYLLDLAAIALPDDQQGELESIIRSSCSAIIKAAVSKEYLERLLALLDDSMKLILSHPSAPKIPITSGLINKYYGSQTAFRSYNDPAALQKCQPEELQGLYILGVMYQIFAVEEKRKANSASWWLLNLPRFFNEWTNLEKLASNSVTVAIDWRGSLLTKGAKAAKTDDPISEKMFSLLEGLSFDSGGAMPEAYCHWSQENAKNPSLLSTVTSFSSLSTASRSNSTVTVRKGEHSPSHLKL